MLLEFYGQSYQLCDSYGSSQLRNNSIAIDDEVDSPNSEPCCRLGRVGLEDLPHGGFSHGNISHGYAVVLGEAATMQNAC